MSRPTHQTKKFGGCQDQATSRLKNFEDVETETDRDSSKASRLRISLRRFSRDKPLKSDGSIPRLGYTGRIVWQYYTEALYSIGIEIFSKASYTIPKLYQHCQT